MTTSEEREYYLHLGLAGLRDECCPAPDNFGEGMSLIAPPDQRGMVLHACNCGREIRWNSLVAGWRIWRRQETRACRCNCAFARLVFSRGRDERMDQGNQRKLGRRVLVTGPTAGNGPGIGGFPQRRMESPGDRRIHHR